MVITGPRDELVAKPLVIGFTPRWEAGQIIIEDLPDLPDLPKARLSIRCAVLALCGRI